MLIAIKDGQAKRFLFHHSRTCFELFVEPESKTITRKEFETLGFLFNFSKEAVGRIFDEFDVSGNNVMI